MVKISCFKLVFIFGLLQVPILYAASEKILYHLHNINQDSYHRTINNIENLMKGMQNDQLDIKILFQGNSIQLLNLAKHPPELNQRFFSLLNNGATIELGKQNFQLHRSEVDASLKATLVPSIFERIVNLQNLGYIYITP